MNERIQELAYDAEDYADTMVDGGSEFHVVFVRKFAELIVRECARVAFNDWCEGTNESSSEMAILKHFGVEE